MLRALDMLGGWKWPSVLAITAVPLLSFFTTWGGWDRGLGSALYGPELVAGLPVVLAHPDDTGPLHAAQVEWSLRTCADCTARLKSARLGYAACSAPPARWTPLQGAAGRLQATLIAGRHDAVDGGSRANDVNGAAGAASAAGVGRGPGACIWLELETTVASEPQQWRWALGRAAKPASSSP